MEAIFKMDNNAIKAINAVYNLVVDKLQILKVGRI